MPRNSRSHRRITALSAQVVLAWLLLASPSAAAGIRYADAASADTTGTCATEASACRLDHAVAGAAAGDEVIVLPGDYTVNYEVKATSAVNVHGADGEPRPRLLGAVGHAFPTLRMGAGGTVSHLHVETSSAVALELAGGARGDRLMLVANNTAAGAQAVRLLGAVVPTTLTNSVASSAGTGSASAVKIADGALAGTATLVNVTAVATDPASYGVDSDLALTSAVAKNVIARGGSKDLFGRAGSMPISVSSSNFRPGSSAGYLDAGFNQDHAITFADGEYRLAEGSPAIDAGILDVLVDGTKDLDGKLRVIGLFPDIGAFEFQPPPLLPSGGGGGEGGSGDSGSGSTGGSGSGGSDGAGRTDLTAPIGALPAFATPILGSSVGAQPGTGTVLVQVPGASEPVPLTQGASIPVGSIIDASDGHVRITSVRDSSGRLQTGEFWGGQFQVRQKGGRRPLTELVLTGGDFSVCRNARDGRNGRNARSAGNLATAARKRDRARVRRLWGRDRKGRFRTKGRNSHATVRGTVWLVEDRCNGTLTRVREGKVKVRDHGRRRSKLVRAGGRYLARSRSGRSRSR